MITVVSDLPVNPENLTAQALFDLESVYAASEIDFISAGDAILAAEANGARKAINSLINTSYGTEITRP